MKYITSQKAQAFTLIELIVSMAIFAIIMVSVISIFIFSSQLSGKIEINRVLQENIKNVVETIAEDVRKNGLAGVSDTLLSSCSFAPGAFRMGTKLCTGTSEYYFAKQGATGTWIRIEDAAVGCEEKMDQCRIVKKVISSGEISPLSNNFISFRDFSFALFGGDVPYIILNFRIEPSVGKGVQANLIEQSELIFQTTLSERIVKIN